MGCVGGKTVEPRCDVPQEGEEHRFLVQKEGLIQNDFIVHDLSNPKQPPWMRLNHSEGAHLEKQPGTIKLQMFKCESASTLMSAELGLIDLKGMKSGPELKEFLNRCMARATLIDSNEKAAIGLQVQRGVTVKDGMGVAVASLTVKIECGCKVMKTGGHKGPGDTEMKPDFTTKFKAKSITFLNGNICGQSLHVTPSVTESKSSGWGSDLPWSLTYSTEPNVFKVEYKGASVGKDKIDVQSTTSINPLVGLMMAYVIARWMHPNVIEKAAKEKAVQMCLQHTERLKKDKSGGGGGGCGGCGAG